MSKVYFFVNSWGDFFSEKSVVFDVIDSFKEKNRDYSSDDEIVGSPESVIFVE